MLVTMEEVWKQIEDYPNYQVSNLGRIKSLNYRLSGKEKVLKPYLNKQSGYNYVALYKDGKAKMGCIAPLVNKAFNGIPDIGQTTDHINRNRSDDRACNLRWASWSTQNVNQNKKTNKLGEKHISHVSQNCYQVTWARNNLRHVQYFSTLDEAKEFRDKNILYI